MSSKSSFYTDSAVTNTQSVAIEASVDNAAASATASENSANNASTSASTATTKASEASTSASTATTKASEASTSASTATTKASEASTSASTATTKATESATSATASANSATAASTSASTATTKASEASSSASTALSHKNDAQTAKTAAETAETNAETAETNAASSATAASTSASSASTSASTATTKAGEAATSASTATTKASEAATSASNASTSASTAATKASEASTSATNASNSASAALASKDAALAALDSFEDIYLGQKSSNPSTDNDGNALVTGALFFDTTSNVMKVYEGSNWVAAYASASGSLLATNNLSDLASISGARANLGLGTVATTATTAYATAAQGTKADSALQTKSDIEGLGIDVPATNLTGTIPAARLSTATTQAESDDSTKIATTAYVVDKITTLIGGAPSTLNDLNELAAAINDDANYNSTLTTALGTKLPKAGGTMTGDVLYNDNVKAKFGADSDLQIYHNGSNSYIKEGGTGNLNISTDGGELALLTQGGLEYGVRIIQDGAVEIRHDDSTKIATTSTGVQVTGNISNATGDFTLDVAGDIILDTAGADIRLTLAGSPYGKINLASNNVALQNLVSDGDLLFKGNDGGVGITALTLDMSDAGTAIFGNEISLGDTKAVKFGSSNDFQIFHDGSGFNQIIAVNDHPIQIKTSSENMIKAIPNGAVELYHNNAKKFETTSGGVTVTGTVAATSYTGDGSNLTGISDTNTTYSAGGGLSLSGTTFSINSDQRNQISSFGSSAYDFISFGSGLIDFKLDGNIDMRLENDGDLHVDGNVIAYSTTISDERLKKDIVKIDNALDKVSQLNGYTFEYLADGKKSAGVIAQEVEKVMPSAITESTLPLKMGEDDKTEYKTVQYDQLHGLMIEAIKELKAEIEELKNGSTK